MPITPKTESLFHADSHVYFGYPRDHRSGGDADPHRELDPGAAGGLRHSARPSQRRCRAPPAPNARPRPHGLKGFAEPVPAWRVLSARDVESRFAATRTGNSAPLVGRQEGMRSPCERANSGSPPKCGPCRPSLIGSPPGGTCRPRLSPWISTTWPRPWQLPSQARNSSPISFAVTLADGVVAP
jgi:hypothetical protein